MKLYHTVQYKNLPRCSAKYSAAHYSFSHCTAHRTDHTVRGGGEGKDGGEGETFPRQLTLLSTHTHTHTHTLCNAYTE